MLFFPPLEELLREFALKKQEEFGIVVASPAQLQYRTMLGVGVGFRALNVDDDIRDYLTAEMGEDVTADVPLAGDVIFPYLNVVVQVPLGQKAPFLRNRAFVELDGQWMSSLFIEDQSGSENVPVTYMDVEVGDAATDWRFYFGEYYSLGTRLAYVPTEVRTGSFMIKPRITGAVGFSYFHNKVALSMDMGDAKLIQAIGAETLEEDYDVYVSSKTFLELQGVGTYVEPAAGLMVSRGRFSASVNVGYRAETVPITITERTVYGDGEEVTKSKHKAEMNTSGMQGSAIISYSF